jgi:hypothetical protein
MVNLIFHNAWYATNRGPTRHRTGPGPSRLAPLPESQLIISPEYRHKDKPIIFLRAIFRWMVRE